MGLLVIKILTGILIGISCKFIGNVTEKNCLDRRKLEFHRWKYEDYLIIIGLAAFGGLIMWRIPLSAGTIYAFDLLIICENIVVIDSHHRIIPNELLLVTFLLKIGFGIPYIFDFKGFPIWHIADSIIGFIVGFIIFMLPVLLTKKVGAGDMKLAAITGFVLGLTGFLVAVVIMGILVILYVILQRKMPILLLIKTMIPIGPFLATAMMIVMLLQTKIIF